MEIEQASNKDQTDKSTSTKKDANVWNKISDSLNGKNPLPAESKKKSQPSVWEPAQPTPSMQELAKRMSYASIVSSFRKKYYIAMFYFSENVCHIIFARCGSRPIY